MVQHLKNCVVYVDVTLTLADGTVGGASGSGFVVAKDGEIVTNAHVVSMDMEVEGGGTKRADKRAVTVTFFSGTPQAKTYDATVARENHDVDLALLKIDADTPEVISFVDNSDTVMETTPIYACGHPLGLKEISIRTGTVTAHRTWEGRPYIEHDAMTEPGNSGGPVVDQDGQLIGIHTLTLATGNNMTKFAIPANVVRDWLASSPSTDPAPLAAPGSGIKDLLTQANLKFSGGDNGIFDVPYDDGVLVNVHQYTDPQEHKVYMRVYVKLGELPGDDDAAKGQTALKALAFNYDDPIGRLSVWDDAGTLRLYWECQVPISAASADYLRALTDVADRQAWNWNQLIAGNEEKDADFAYPGGDKAQLSLKLKQIITDAGLTAEPKDDYFNLAYDNNVTVSAQIYKGLARTWCDIGGMPGADDAEKGQKAIEFLERNWDDPFGRLGTDKDNDVVWESQIPLSFLTPDYFSLVAGTCDTQVADFYQKYGKTPFNGN
jgi:hypothetical protein